MASKYKKIALAGGTTIIMMGVIILFTLQLLSPVQQYPIVGGIWQNDVNVTGTGYFYVQDYGSRFNVDYEFVGLFCNGNPVATYKWVSKNGNTRYAVKNYNCNGVTSWKVIVLTTGEHKQQVCFGDHRNTKRRICKIVRNFASEPSEKTKEDYKVFNATFRKIKLDNGKEAYSTQDVIDSDYLIATDQLFYGSHEGIVDLKIYVSTKKESFNGKIGIEIDKNPVEIVHVKHKGMPLTNDKSGKNKSYFFDSLIPISGESEEIYIRLKYDPDEIGISDKFDVVLYDHKNVEIQRLDPFLSGWDYRQKLTLQTTNVDMNADVSNDHVIPVYVDPTNTDFWNNTETNGEDVRFTKSDGDTLVDYHFELFDHTGDEMLAWYEATDTFTQSTDVDYYMYYGKSGASDAQNKAGTYPSSYIGVWHMDDNSEETGNVTSTPVGGSPTYSPASGMIYEKGYGAIVDGGDYWYIDTDLFLPAGYSALGSYCFWFDTNTANLQYPMDITSPSQSIYVDVGNYGSDNPSFQWNQGGQWTKGVNYTQDENYLHCVTWQDAADLNAFQNGILDGNHNTASSATGDYTGYWYIGSQRTAGNNTIVGRIDEVQMFNYQLSGNEARLLYEAQAGNLISFGAQEEAPAADANSVNIINPNGDQYLSYIDGNYAIDFNVFSPDDNYVYADIYYSDVPGEFKTAIVTDLNLFDAGENQTVDVNCMWSVKKFYDSAGTRCFYDVNWNFSDGNYYLDINIYTQADINFVDSSDSNFQITNSHPTASLDLEWINSAGWLTSSPTPWFFDGVDDTNNWDLNHGRDYDRTSGMNFDEPTFPPALYHVDTNLNYARQDGNWAQALDINDVVGHQSDINYVYVLVDLTDPEVNIIHPNDNNMSYNSDTVSFDLNNENSYGSDLNVRSVSVDINGTSSSDFDFDTHCTVSDMNYTCSYSESAFDTNGVDYNITIYIDDNATNNTSSQSIFKYVEPIPELDINGVNGYVDTSPFPRRFNQLLDNNLQVQFTTKYGSDESELIFDLNYHTTTNEGGTVIWDDLNLSSDHCTSGDFTSTQTCTLDWNILGILDNNYYLIATVTDGLKVKTSNVSDNNVPIGIVKGNVNEYYRTDENGLSFYPTAFVDYNVTPAGQRDTNGIFQIYNDGEDRNISIILLDRHVLDDFEAFWNDWRPDQNSDAMSPMSTSTAKEGDYGLLLRIDGLPDVNNTVDNNYAKWVNDSMDWNITDSTRVESGAPEDGNFVIYMRSTDPEKIHDVNIIIGNGLDRCVYMDFNFGGGMVTDQWYRIDINLAEGTLVGTPIWSDVNYVSIDFNLATRLVSSEFDFNVIVDFAYIYPTYQALYNQGNGTSLCIDTDNNKDQCMDVNNQSHAMIKPTFDGNTSQMLWLWLDVNFEEFGWRDYFLLDYNISVGEIARAS